MIEFQNVSKTYHIRKFEKHVFTDLNFRIEPGESIGICGANGAGKSTLMRLIAGVEQPSSGRDPHHVHFLADWLFELLPIEPYGRRQCPLHCANL